MLFWSHLFFLPSRRLCLRRVKMLYHRGQLHPQDVVVARVLNFASKVLAGKGRVVARCMRKVGYIFA